MSGISQLKHNVANDNDWNTVSDLRKALDKTNMFIFQSLDNPNH